MPLMNRTKTLSRIAAAGVFTAMLFPTAAFAMEGVTQSDDPDVMTITAVTEDTSVVDQDSSAVTEDASRPDTPVSSEDSADVVLEDGTAGSGDDVKRTTAEELMSTTGLPVSQESNSQGTLVLGGIALAAAVAAGVVVIRRRATSV
jgi:hypothetical protein